MNTIRGSSSGDGGLTWSGGTNTGEIRKPPRSLSAGPSRPKSAVLRRLPGNC